MFGTLRVARVALLLSLCASGAHARDFFVSPTGDDTNPGTESRPFLTVRAGIAAGSQPGDTIWLRGGVYSTDGENWNNQANLNHAGTADAWITLRNYPGELPILDGTGLAGTEASGVEPNSDVVEYVQVIGLVSRNWESSG